jgi:hypothetical protein
VLRRPAAADARRLELLPTRRGLDLRRRAPGPSQDRVIAAVAALTPKQQRALADGLETLTRALGIDERAAPMLFADEPRSPPRRPSQRKRGNKRA